MSLVSKSTLECQLSRTTGRQIEITVRGLREFTLSTEGDAREEMKEAEAFLNLTSQIAGWRVEYDASCDLTCAYFTLTK